MIYDRFRINLSFGNLRINTQKGCELFLWSSEASVGMSEPPTQIRNAHTQEGEDINYTIWVVSSHAYTKKPTIIGVVLYSEWKFPTLFLEDHNNSQCALYVNMLLFLFFLFLFVLSRSLGRFNLVLFVRRYDVISFLQAYLLFLARRRKLSWTQKYKISLKFSKKSINLCSTCLIFVNIKWYSFRDWAISLLRFNQLSIEISWTLYWDKPDTLLWVTRLSIETKVGRLLMSRPEDY